ncbi:MAG: cobalamin-dependent protein, partial [Planctomycetes bacterium]|nr:cobalamin-dependent protein [Planctomycetota bacterium]
PVPPLGAAFVAAAVRERGHDARILDLCFHREPEAVLAATLRSFAPDVVGISIRNVDNVAFPRVKSYLEGYRAVARICREHAPRAAIFVGGSAFSLFPEEFMEELEADFGVVGEGETAFADMVDEIDRSGRVTSPFADRRGIVRGSISRTGAGGVSPAFDLLDVARYFREGGSVNIQTKRGCPFRCVYCSYPLLEGSQVRERDPALVVDEIEANHRAHGVDAFHFVDNIFNVPAGQAAAVCDEICRRGLKIRWTAHVTPAGCTREILDRMRRSGCRSADFGTDSFCDEQLARLGKSFDAAQIFRVADWCRELGLRHSHSLIFGGPGETWETVRETVENTARSRPNAVIATIGVRLYRGTPIAEDLIARGLIDRGQIGIAPVFFISESVRDGIVEYLEAVAGRLANWILPGTGKNMNERFFQRVRSRGIRGPLWELFDPIDFREIDVEPPPAREASPRGPIVRAHETSREDGGAARDDDDERRPR